LRNFTQVLTIPFPPPRRSWCCPAEPFCAYDPASRAVVTGPAG